MLHFKGHLLWRRSPKSQKSPLWRLLPIIKDSSPGLVLLFFIGSWNTTDLVRKPIECCRRISASLQLLLIGAMKMPSKQADACKKKSFNRRYCTLHRSIHSFAEQEHNFYFVPGYLYSLKKTPFFLPFLIEEWWVQSYFCRDQDMQSFQKDHRIRAKAWET